jgi:class 3 adenylate cyclase
VDASELEAAGLYDPDAPRAAERLALLDYLRERGASLDELVVANRLGRLPGVAGDLVRKDHAERLTARELSARVGFSLDQLRPVWRAAGFPDVSADEPLFFDEDVEAFRSFVLAADFFGERATLDFTRALGAAMASVADAALGLFGLQVQSRLVEKEAPEIEFAQAIEGASLSLQQQVPAVLDVFFKHHVEAALRRAQIAGAEASGTTFRGAIGFLDIVGSTFLTRDLDAHDLMSIVADFEQATSDAVVRREGRVVKHIGDEVMFVTTDAADACEAALDLSHRFRTRDHGPLLRGGVAFGNLVRGYGDFYGPLVNLAARAVKHAEPGTVLVTTEVRDAAADRSGLRFVPAGEQTLRGFDAPVALYALERA